MINSHLQKTSALGLDTNDLQDAICEILSERAISRAEAIKDEGLTGQIEFLLADYCDDRPNILIALLEKIALEKRAD